ncbi:MAG: right-handed parallel beta-helix repeat-containing protein [Myxococcota bacterium]
MRSVFWAFALGLLVPAWASAATLSVGPDGDFATLRDALAAAADGDRIEIAAGRYVGDGGNVDADNLTIVGVGGVAHLDSAGQRVTGRKGVLVVRAMGVTIENLEISGADISAGDGCNGAGVRLEGGNFTVRNVYFHDNENGILGTPNGEAAQDSDVTIEDSRFERNGTTDNGRGCRGFSHGIYINRFRRLTVTGSLFHRSNFGHELKSRALENVLMYNRFSNEDGSGSREVEFTTGGLAVLVGNVIQQTRSGQNSQMVSFAMEGAEAPMEFYAVNNTLINERGSGSFLNVGRSGATVYAANNLFVGGGSVFQGDATTELRTNLESSEGFFADRSALDLRLNEGAAAIDAGEEPGEAAGISLRPTLHYVFPTGTEPRPLVATLDLGAFEYGEGAPAEDAGSAPMDGGVAIDAGVQDAGSDGAIADVGIDVDGGSALDAASTDATAPDGGGELDGGSGCRAGGGANAFALSCLVLILLGRRRGRS